MSKLTRWTIGFVIPLCFVAAISQAGESKVTQTSSLKTHRDIDGQTYFALNLRPTMQEPVQRQRDILLLVDTSASQTGLFREDTIEAVDTIVRGLRDEERVHIMAVDIKAVPMTDGFVKVGSKELAAGLAKLKARTPLGATDLVHGIESAISQFKDTKRARTIVYIGDGMSRANLPAFDELDPLMQKLVDHRVSVNSFAVGLRCDLELLAVIANNSGGSIFIDGPAVTAQDAGMASLKMARGAVVWPVDVDWSTSISQAYPTRIPPMRFDRDSVLIGTMVGKNAVKLKLEAELYGKKQTLNYTLMPTDTTVTDDYAMVSELVTIARKTDGLMLSLLGNEGLEQARRMFQVTSANLSKLGKQALARGDREAGVNLLREALRRDPGNAEAKALMKANTSVRAASTKGIAAQVDGDDDPFGGDIFGDDPVADELEPAEIEPSPLEPSPVQTNPAEVLPEIPTEVPADLVTEPTPVPSNDAISPPAGQDRRYVIEPLVMNGVEQVSDSDLLLNAEQERELMEAMMRAEVTRSLSVGRDTMRQDPAATIENLKNLRESIVQSPDLSSSVRAELLDRLEIGLRAAASQRIVKDRLDEAARANIAELEGRRRLLDASIRKQQVIQQYVDQVNAFLDEGRFFLAEEVALQMRDEAPRMVAPTTAVARAGYIGNYNRSEAIHALSSRNFADSLYQVEVAHVPFPDDPPIVYPPADEWGPLSERRKERYSQFDMGETGPAERRISTALQGMLKEPLSFADEPLATVIAQLREDYEIPIQLDTQALSDENVSSDEPVSIEIGNISLRSALRLLLRDIDLTYVIDNEVLMITSKEKAEETLVTKVYPVGDLVMPINSMMMMGGGMMGGGMMGGMGGGMGGMGGGMGGMGGGMGGMGGGMGGMGGGMGGMGGGMGGMGGGMGGMGGGMFDVEDVLSLKPKTTSKAPATSAPAASKTAVAPQRIEPARKANESSTAAWDRHFAKLWASDVTVDEERQNFADVRETIRQLTSQKKHKEVAVVIQSALRHGQYQPWMHGILGMSLRATGADNDMIERALMSSVDLSQNPDQILTIANQLSRLGMDERAMQLYRDIATSFPLRPEPYMHALEAAKRMKDQDGIRWACEHILSQAWPEKQKFVFDKAIRSAKAALYDLERAGNKVAAAEMADTLNEALARDCVVRVSWTGDADVDLLVQEPSGTVCSLRNKRTTGGGVMLGDSIPNPSEQSEDGMSETYVCPKGFSGEYQVLVRRIYGDVAAGKVNVEILTNLTTDEVGTTANQRIQQQIDLREKDAVVIFELKDGRREDSIEDHIVANAAVRHVEVNRSILGQQFDRLADDRVAASNSLADLELLRTRDPRQAARVQAALRGRGAVGFMPVIQQFPEGTMMMGQAVISADRRYVRVSMSPFFSRVADVATFNFVTGQGNNQQQGGAGGQQGGGGVGGGGFGGGGGGGIGGGGGFGGGGF